VEIILLCNQIDDRPVSKFVCNLLIQRLVELHSLKYGEIWDQLGDTFHQFGRNL
jgi:hypothetical protein